MPNNSDESEVRGNQVIPHFSIATSLLVQTMKDAVPGDVFTDEQLTEICHRNTSVRGNGYANLTTAIRQLRQRHGLVFRRVRNAGCVKCLESEEILSHVGGEVKSIHKKGRVCREKITQVNIASLPAEKQTDARILTVQVATITAFASGAMSKKLVSRISPLCVEVDHKKLLEAVVKAIKDK